MKLSIKNPVIKTILKKGETGKASGSTAEIGHAIIGGYVYSLLDVAGFPEVNIKLDLTYKTIKELPKAIAWEFSVGMNRKSVYTISQNIEIAEKSIASYLMLLAVNEENAELVVSEASDRNIKTISAPDRWSGFDITARRGIAGVDFLKEIHGSVFINNSELTIQMDKAIKAYKNLTGKDLGLYGVDGLIGSFKP